MIAYLSGPIENAHNDGADWRVMITEWLDSELNHQVFNPVIETKSIVEKISVEDFRLLKNYRIYISNLLYYHYFRFNS